MRWRNGANTLARKNRQLWNFDISTRFKLNLKPVPTTGKKVSWFSRSRLKKANFVFKICVWNIVSGKRRVSENVFFFCRRRRHFIHVRTRMFFLPLEPRLNLLPRVYECKKEKKNASRTWNGAWVYGSLFTRSLYIFMKPNWFEFEFFTHT